MRKQTFSRRCRSRKQDGVLRDHGAYRRTDFRINLDHRPREDFQFSVSGYHSRSRREELDGDLFFNLTATAPDVNLLDKDPDGTKFIFQPDPQGVHPNPLYMAETQENSNERMRTLGSVNLRYTPAQWLSADANASYDRTDRHRSFFLDRGLKSENQALGDPGRLSLDDLFNSALNASGSVSLLKEFNKFTARTTARVLIEKQTEQSATASGTNFAVSGVPRFDARIVAQQRLIVGRGQGGRVLLDGRDRLRQPHHSRRAHSSRRQLAVRPGRTVGTPTIERVRRTEWRRNRGGRGSGSTSSSSVGHRAPRVPGPSFADQYETYTIARTAPSRSPCWAIASSSQSERRKQNSVSTSSSTTATRCNSRASTCGPPTSWSPFRFPAPWASPHNGRTPERSLATASRGRSKRRSFATGRCRGDSA